MTTTMSDLTEDLISEILSRVPITSLGSVRSTCKNWKALSRNRIFGKVGEAKNQFMGFMMKDLRICSVKIDLQGICNDGNDSTDVSIKQVSVLNEIEVCKAYHCDGLLLCFPTDHSSLLVWNPYLGQMRSIPHEIHPFHSFALGYDNNRNHKILEILGSGYNIYELSSNSWKFIDVSSNWKINAYPHGVTLKGNAYFYAQEDVVKEGGVTEMEDFLLCFDFTSERFGSRLSLPFHYSIGDNVVLSCVRDEKLAVFYQSWSTQKIVEIWVTNKIEHNEVSWTKCLEVNMNLLTGYRINNHVASFFIDEERKVAVVFDLDTSKSYENCFYQKAQIIGQDGYFESINVGGAAYRDSFGFLMLPLLCSSSYVPNLVQID